MRRCDCHPARDSHRASALVHRQGVSARKAQSADRDRHEGVAFHVRKQEVRCRKRFRRIFVRRNAAGLSHRRVIDCGNGDCTGQRIAQLNAVVNDKFDRPRRCGRSIARIGVSHSSQRRLPLRLCGGRAAGFQFENASLVIEGCRNISHRRVVIRKPEHVFVGHEVRDGCGRTRQRGTVRVCDNDPRIDRCGCVIFDVRDAACSGQNRWRIDLELILVSAQEQIATDLIEHQNVLERGVDRNIGTCSGRYSDRAGKAGSQILANLILHHSRFVVRVDHVARRVGSKRPTLGVTTVVSEGQGCGGVGLEIDPGGHIAVAIATRNERKISGGSKRHRSGTVGDSRAAGRRRVS